MFFVFLQMTEEFQQIGNIKFYEIDSMICTGNSTQDSKMNALVTDIRYASIKIPGTISFFNTTRKVELIGNSSFQQCSAKSFFIPRFIKEIRRDAFISCPFLKKIVFEDNSELYYIGRGAFYEDRKLLQLYIPSSVKYMQIHCVGANISSTIFYCGDIEITSDVFRKEYFTEAEKIVYVTEYYPSNKFGGIEVQEKKFSCFHDYYKKCYKSMRKSSNNINLLTIEIILLVYS